MLGLALSAALVLFIYIAIAVNILVKDYRSRTHQLFFLMCLGLMVWSCSAIFVHTAQTKQELIRWYRIGICGGIPFFAFALHFHIRLTGLVRPRLPFWIALYLLDGAVLYSNLFHQLMHRDFIREAGRWIFIPANQSPLYVFYAVFSGSCMMASVGLLLKSGVRARSVKERRRSILISSGLFLAVSLFIVEIVLLPYFCSYQSAGAGPLFLVIWMASIWFAMIRYRFMEVSPANLGPEIFNSITDVVLSVDFSGQILLANSAAAGLYGRTPDGLRSLSLGDLVQEADELSTLLAELGEGKRERVVLRCRLCGPDANKTVSVEARFSLVRDRFGDRCGVLMICKELCEQRLFQSVFHLTGRELELARLVSEGRSNRETARLLGITERTVKAHISSIYEKCAVSNKVQLVQLLLRFGVIEG